MTLNDISNIFAFLGGFGMFLYGMHLMADGMQKSAGDKMRNILGMLTNNRFMAVGIGALITAIVQSSSTTTVMIVGFVSAGLMNLSQAVGVIMGANIGTTVTAWLVSISQLGTAFKLMKPSFYAPLIVGIGAIIILFSKKQKTKIAGEIMIGIGLLFIGLDFMSDSIDPYTELPIVGRSFEILGKNPFLGVLIGAVVTAIIQSSSASVGILQTLALSGVVTTSSAVFITLGQNIGSCVTAILSSITASKTAKRAAMIHLSFNVIGTVVFGGIAAVYFFVNQAFAHQSISAVEISIFHTIFNISNTLLLLPFANKLVNLSKKMIKETEEENQLEVDQVQIAKHHLDPRILEAPALAIETAINEVVHLGELASDNLSKAMHCVIDGAIDLKPIFQRELEINQIEKILTEYLVQVDNLPITLYQKKVVNNLFYMVSDVERIADHAENIAEQAKYLRKHDLTFSDTAVEDLLQIGEQAQQAVANAIMARKSLDFDTAHLVAGNEKAVDKLEKEMRKKHIKRLSTKKCTPSTGVVFLDVISNLERISDHAYNIAGYVLEEENV